MVELLNLDCIGYMREQADNAFDLAIVDPPYGIGNSCLKNNKTRTKLAHAKNYKTYANGKNDRPTPEYFHQLMRVSRNQIIWGANHLCDLFNAQSSGWIVWNKLTGGSCFADSELAFSSFPGAVKEFTFMWSGMRQGDPSDGRKMQGNKRLNEQRIHPSQKPVQLYKWLMLNYAEKGQRILDTHLGSGSSAIAAKCFGCDFVGTEIDADFYSSAVKRFDQTTRQNEMFS